MNVIIYKRVSTETQKERGFSLRHQDEMLRRYCEFKGYNIVNAYTEDFSAKDFNRPEFQKLLLYVKANKKKVDLILFTKWDRFARNLEEALRTIRELKGKGVSVQAIEQPLDLENVDNKTMLALYLVGPEVENDKISARTIDGLLRARKEGAWPGKAPYGYSNFRNDSGKSTLIPNNKSDLVITAFEEVEKNIESIDSIRRRLKEKGMELCKQAFLNMLKNVAYIGKVNVPAYKKDEEYITDGLHEGIVTEELFRRVQLVIKGRRKGDSIPSHKNEAFPLRNFIVCAVCGQNLNGSKSRGRSGVRYAYYHCRKRCPTYVPEQVVDMRFIEMLGSLNIKEEVILLFGEILKDVFGNSEKETQKKIKQLILEKEELDSKIIKAEDRLLAEDIALENFNKITNRLSNRIMDINNEILVLSEKKENPVNYLNASRLVLTNLDSLYKKLPYDLKRTLIGSIFPEKVVISNEDCRTTSCNEVMIFLTSIERDSRLLECKKPLGLSGLSTFAPFPGLEPGTP